VCQAPIRSICPDRFNTSEGFELSICKHILYNNGNWYTPPGDGIWKVVEGGDVIREAFGQYFACLKKVAYQTRVCAEMYLDIPCRVRPVRVIKTVRTDASVPSRLFAEYANFRLMHVLRDPRGVVVSRRKKSWAQGQFEGNPVSLIAKTYCSKVLKDYIKTVILRNQHPGKVIHVIIDGVMQNVEDAADALYNFINMTMPYEIRYRIRLDAGQISYQRINVWKLELSRSEMQTIADVCYDFYRDLKFEWYYSRIKIV
jgi:hypothetical protein